MTPLPAGADALTVTADGVWIDGAREAATDATFFRALDGTVTTWCDDGCDHPFGARFSRGQGYRSIAFAGGGRVISNPLPPGGGDEDNRGAYLVLRGNDFVRMPGGGGQLPAQRRVQLAVRGLARRAGAGQRASRAPRA